MEFIRSALIFSTLLLAVLAQKPALSLEPRAAAVRMDEAVSFRCRVLSGAQPVHLEWRRTNNQPLADNVKVGPDGSVLTVASAQPGNQGGYRCVATNAQGKTSVTAMLSVKQPPKVRVTPSGPVRVALGQTVSLECQASGRPRPSVTWLKQEAGRGTVLATTTTEARATLEVAVSVLQDSGVYVCRAQNKDGTAEESVEIKVQGGVGPRASVSRAEISAVEGQTVTMHCQASGTPTPEITWSKLRAPLPYLHRAEGGTLTLTNVGRQDSGQYICNTTNSDGFDEAYVQLEVDTRPYATSIPDHVTARRGDSMRLRCIAHGSHPISFRWLRVGGAGLPAGARTTGDGILSIPHLRVADAGTYKCVATNRIGSGETAAVVSVTA